ncbi:ScbR family autoregulator-binding transcription factor [Micromonospora sp. WMMD714]|uniref:ScbR family autoregulator-binding transcription factor n=1 Tax=Micromonospora sp. WMMD714 TaxID=3016097 RepID=UPI00249C6286|nr:ScbR family autoregulator-binding transcription factor [Micromonospora sp. WMMD714]
MNDPWRSSRRPAKKPRQMHAPRQDRAVRTHGLLLGAAAGLFAERGFRNTSLQDVAEAIDMTKGAVYFYFPNKESLARAVVEEHYARWPKMLEEVSSQGLDPFATMIAMLDRAALAFRDDVIIRAGARLQIERDLIDVELPTPYLGWTALLTDLLEAAAREGQLAAGVDPAQAARVLVATFFGIQHISEQLNHRKDLLERWGEAARLLVSSIAASPGQNSVPS